VGAIPVLEVDGFHGTSPHCCGGIAARIAYEIYVVAAARAAEVKARYGRFGGQRGTARPKRRFVNSLPV
jgi:hypothetical protein